MNTHNIALGQYNLDMYQPNNFAIGEYGFVPNSISIGELVSRPKHQVAMGYNASPEGDYGIQIGTPDITDNNIFISNLDIRKMDKRIQELEDIVEKQNEMIEALWYAPGMPGYQEGKEMWDSKVIDNN